MDLQNKSNLQKPKVAIYVRVSTLHQIDKDSLPMQKKDLIAYANLMLGTDDYVIFEDAGYSGKNTSRPKFQEMMSKIRTGVFTHLLVWKIDRISRNLLDFASMYDELKRLGIIFISKNEQFDTSTAIGEAMLKIILVFAELERNMTSERVTATMISRANNGLWNGGRIPYGYNYNLETHEFSINPEESKIVKIIHDLYEEMKSLVYEARYLNEKGYRTRAGNQWSVASLHIILTNVFYCGDYRYNVLKEGNRQQVKDKSEWITIPDHHVPIISKEQKNRILSILDSNTKLKQKPNTTKLGKYPHIFAGIISCGICGNFMRATSGNITRDGWYYSKYLCIANRDKQNHCENKATSDPIIGEFVFNYILNMVNVQKSFASISSPKELQEKLLFGDTFRYIDSIESDGLNDLYNVLLSGKITEDIYGKGIKIKPKKTIASEKSRLRSDKKKLEQALDRLTDLYLFSPNKISEEEYISKRENLINQLEEIASQIGFNNTETLKQSLSDEEFIQQANTFMISQKLANRNYINYKNLAKSVDANILKKFVQSIFDNIIVKYGRITTIIFKNGLSHNFIYKN